MACRCPKQVELFIIINKLLYQVGPLVIFAYDARTDIHKYCRNINTTNIVVSSIMCLVQNDNESRCSVLGVADLHR